MKDVTIEEFCTKYNACAGGVLWAKDNCPSGMMSEAYDKLSKATSVEEKNYFEWVYLRAWEEKTLRLLAVRFVRETPLADGRKVFDLLTDEWSINALVVAEKYALGLASKEELDAARDAARATAQIAAQTAAWATAQITTWDAARAARDAARDAQIAAQIAARDAARATAQTAARATRDAQIAAWDAARDAQLGFIHDLGNPFKD